MGCSGRKGKAIHHLFLIILLLLPITCSAQRETLPPAPRDERFPAGTYLVYEVSHNASRTTGFAKGLFEDWGKEMETFFNRTPVFLIHIGISNFTETILTGQEAYSGLIASVDKAVLIIEVLNATEAFYLVNYTIVFYNFSAYTSEIYRNIFESFFGFRMELKEIVKEEGRIKWATISLPLFSVTRLLLVDKRTNEVLDFETGEGLGEWIHWLQEDDLRSEATVILADFKGAPLGEENVYNAVLVYVNSSWKSPLDYAHGSVRVKRAKTAVGRTHPGIARWRHHERMRGTLEWLARDWERFGYRVVDYGNGTVELVNVLLSEVYERAIAHKPWRLGEHTVKGRPPELLTFVRVDYAGYPHFVDPSPEFNLVYEVGRGVLLLYNQSLGSTSSPFLNYLSRGELRVRASTLPGALELRLVDTNLVLDVPELGGPGGPDEQLHFLVFALAAAAALLLALGWRR